MRIARMKTENGGFYHCISRIIERRRILKDPEKEAFRRLMRKVETFCGVRVLTYAILESHWHIFLHVPPPREISDSELIERLSALYKPDLVEEVAGKLPSPPGTVPRKPFTWIRPRTTISGFVSLPLIRDMQYLR